MILLGRTADNEIVSTVAPKVNDIVPPQHFVPAKSLDLRQRDRPLVLGGACRPFIPGSTDHQRV
jgi:hypothetical protein